MGWPLSPNADSCTRKKRNICLQVIYTLKKSHLYRCVLKYLKKIRWPSKHQMAYFELFKTNRFLGSNCFWHMPHITRWFISYLQTRPSTVPFLVGDRELMLLHHLSYGNTSDMLVKSSTVSSSSAWICCKNCKRTSPSTTIFTVATPRNWYLQRSPPAISCSMHWSIAILH